MPTPRLRIGQLLVDARLISAAALDEVLAAQRSDGRRLGTLLVERGLINETQLTQILSHQLSVPWVSLLHIEFSRQLLNLVPRQVADRFCLVPIYVRHVRNQGDTLYVAMDDPSNEDGLRACREHSGLPVRSMIAPPADIRSAIRVYYGVDSTPLSPPSPAATDLARKEPGAAVAPPPETQPTSLLATPEASSPPAPSAPSTQPTPPPAPEQPTPAPISDAPSPAPQTRREPAVHASGPLEPALVATAPDVSPPADAPTEAASPDVALPDEGHPAAPPVEGAAAPVEEAAPKPESAEGPEIEAVEIAPADRLRGILAPPETPLPPSAPPADIPRPRGRAPRMVSLTLLDGTTINLPAKRRGRRADAEGPQPGPAEPPMQSPLPPPGTSDIPAGLDSVHGLTARDLVLALRVVANGADASEVLGENLRWEALFSALLSLMLKKHLIADWEFIDELKKQL